MNVNSNFFMMRLAIVNALFQGVHLWQGNADAALGMFCPSTAMYPDAREARYIYQQGQVLLEAGRECKPDFVRAAGDWATRPIFARFAGYCVILAVNIQSAVGFFIPHGAAFKC